MGLQLQHQASRLSFLPATLKDIALLVLRLSLKGRAQRVSARQKMTQHLLPADRTQSWHDTALLLPLLAAVSTSDGFAVHDVNVAHSMTRCTF